MSTIQISNLTFAYDGSYQNVFENVTFHLDSDWKLGLIGRNGRGKTTLFRLLCKQYPYQGSIISDVIFDYFPYKVANPAALAMEVAEDLLPDLEYWRLAKELALLEVDDATLYQPFATLSKGEQVKLLLCVMFLRENHFLLIDEPTNHLDVNGRMLLGQYLAKKKGFLLVSHDRTFLDQCIDHVMSINRTDITVQKGNFSTWWQNYEYRLQHELAEDQRIKKEIVHLKSASRQTAQWSQQIEKKKFGGGVPDRGFIGHKSAKMMQRAKNAQHRLERAAAEKEGLLKNREDVQPLKLQFLRHPRGTLIQAQDFVPYYANKQICQPLRFTLNQGARVAVTGKNGCGKSTLLRCILNEADEQRSQSGTLQLASGLTISYVSQDTSFLQGTLRDYVQQCGVEESLFKAILRKLDFSREQREMHMEHLSEGQKKKVLIARSLCEQAHLYLWDEPLNYIDVFSRIQIENLLLEYQPTILFVEHDRAFVERIATQQIDIYRA